MEQELPARLRLSAEAIPAELYSWLHPLLIEAAEELERLARERDSWADAYQYDNERY